MKKIIYVCLLAVLAISYGCSKDEVFTEEQNRNPEKKEWVNEIEKRKFPQQNGNLNINSNYSRGTGFSDGDGNIFDGGNNGNTPPTESYWTLLTEYPAGTTALQKNELRIPYQINGQLLYYEQCPNDPNKELWYMYHNDSNTTHPIDPLGNPKDDDPEFPETYPGSSTNFHVLDINESCYN